MSSWKYVLNKKNYGSANKCLNEQKLPAGQAKALWYIKTKHMVIKPHVLPNDSKYGVMKKSNKVGWKSTIAGWKKTKT